MSLLAADEDRKKAAADQKAKRKTAAALTPHSDASSDTSASVGGARMRRHPGYRPSKVLPPQQLSSSPMRELEDETDEDVKVSEEVKDAPRDRSSGEGGDVPWHHAQLYQLYGQQADYFLHPKPPVTEQRRQTHPKLKHHKGG
nr:hypothetical protein BaRGS_026139 [Batillaria attramentaria]